MRIQSICQYYSTPLNNIKKVEKKGNNVQFGSDSEKYDAAYSFFKQVSKVDALEKKLDNLKQGGFILGVPLGDLCWKLSLIKTLNALEKEKAILETYNRCYQSYGPAEDEFLRDVDRGREQEEARNKERNKEKSKERSKARTERYSSDEKYSSYAEFIDLTNEVSTYP